MNTGFMTDTQRDMLLLATALAIQSLMVKTNTCDYDPTVFASLGASLDDAVKSLEMSREK